MRYVAAIVLLLALLGASPAHAQGCGPSNPNCIVPTAPPGTSNNQAASTAFVQAAIGTDIIAGTGISVSCSGTPTQCTISMVVPVSAANGGTGVNNGSNTITVGGAFAAAAALSLPAVVQGDTWFGSGAGVISALAKNTTATRYIANTGASNNPAWAQVDLTNGVTGILPSANGGTGVNNASTITVGGALVTAGAASLPVIAQGDLWFGSGAGVVSALAKSASATRYVSNTGALNNPAWAQVNLANGVTGNLPVTNLNSGTSAAATTYWRGDGTWAATVVSVTRQTFCPSGCTTTIAGGATGTYTPTTGFLYGIVETCGGGGGGGGAAAAGVTAQGGAGGGGAGGYTRSVVTAATIGASKVVGIGTAGTAGTAGFNAGGNGGTSCLTTTNCGSGVIVSALGGTGGSGNAGGGGGASGGAGGLAGTGDILGVGQSGNSAVGGAFITVGFLGGNGGSSFLGGGGLAPALAGGATNGVAGTGYCAGGSGGESYNSASTASGGAGTAGIVIITEFNNQ